MAQAGITQPLFWAFVAAAVIYAFAEGTFSNWIVVYPREAKRLPIETGTLALSVFWIDLVIGRLAVSALVVRISPITIWLALPLPMIAAFLLLPHATTPALGIGIFALAGLACSAFFSAHRDVGRAGLSQTPGVGIVAHDRGAHGGVGLGSFAVGAFRKLVSLESLYRISVVYPVLIFVLARFIRRKTAGVAAIATC
jgi:predicted MFS family arabinose efflux permease